MPKTVGVGFIGAGTIANVYADQILHVRRAKLIGVASRTRKHAFEFAKRFALSCCTTNYQDLLKRSDIDVVVVCTPNDLHAEQSISAAEAG